MQKRYMLDTNTVSYLIMNNKETRTNLLKAKLCHSYLCISSITQAELLRGLEKRPGKKDLAILVNEFLNRIEIMAWDAAQEYAILRTKSVKEGKSLSAMDMLIAAHSLATSTILVTSDMAFYQLKHMLKLEDWSKETRMS